VWRRVGVEAGAPHKHCVVCGRPVPIMYTTPGEPPLCSSDCRAKFEAQRARSAKWQSMFNVMLIIMMIWVLIAILLPALTRP